jgi:hypothetical protein
MSSNSVTLNLQSDFPTWTSNFTQRNILVYLRFTIATSQMNFGNSWTAYAYSDPSSTSTQYLISQATGLFPIVNYQLPYLYIINLFTKSFSQRTCTINQKCMFYGFIYPTTSQATIPITKMTFLLPREFNYSTASTLNACYLQWRTTQYQTFNCPVTRNNSQITIGYTPPVYDQMYNILNLDDTSSTNLFTTPSFPGNHYQMQVNLWASNNSLV